MRRSSLLDRSSGWPHRLVMVCALLMPVALPAAELPHVNWEHHPVHALDRSPDGRWLAAAHTADARVQLYTIGDGIARPAGSVRVGLDPVSVRFRTPTELWVINHVSDSINIVDVEQRSVIRTLSTDDEPADVVFAGGQAWVSCSQVNRVLAYRLDDLQAAPRRIDIHGEDPRALAVSPDGRTVYAAIFESGNATTILGGGLAQPLISIPNVVSDPRGPYQGVNPPPNRGTLFDPPLLSGQPAPPAVGLIVRRAADGRWRDDNTGDWTRFVSGDLASASGRREGWNLSDHDIAVIDVATAEVRYHRGLMNIGMALAVVPSSGELTLVGTDALNHIRFEPNLNSTFVRVLLGRVQAGGAQQIQDLNPHLDYAVRTLPEPLRLQAVGDPRGLVWRADGQRGYVSGMGSDNVIALDAQGARVGAPLPVGAGPTGLALDEARQRLYVWNHFEASLSVVDTQGWAEVQRLHAFNPLPAAIRAGRPLLYQTHRTSGLGQSSCASCHVDGRMDRLAWDLGDPGLPMQAFDQNCVTTVQVQPCRDFHAMKGPMTTQTLQDIIGHEPFHWRGDRAGLEAFNPAFTALLGRAEEISAADMQHFEDFLATLTFAPNPFRNFDNSLPDALPLDGHYTSGRFAMAGQPLGTGNAKRGLQRFTSGLLDSPLQCASCHTLPTGMAVNGPLLIDVIGFPVGGRVMPMGPHGENHLGIVSIDGSTNVSMKVPQLRNQFEKTGFEFSRTDNTAGFGFLHDGSVDSLSKFLSAPTFSVGSDREVADLVALTLAFSGSDFGDLNPRLGAAPPLSRDSHAATGAQLDIRSASTPPARFGDMLALARSGRLDLVVRAGTLGYTFDQGTDRLLPDDGGPALSPADLRQRASAEAAQSWTLVPAGLGRRLGMDRDGDGVSDAREIHLGADPTDAGSTQAAGRAGLWFNPARSGHGLDLQYLGTNQFVTWYTYAEDGSPTWYLASGPRANPWQAQLARYTYDPSTDRVSGTDVGSLRLHFDDARSGRMEWRLGNEEGAEVIQPLLPASAPGAIDRTGTWYQPDRPGWGASVYTESEVQVLIVYFYDAAHQPRWAIAQAPLEQTGALPLTSYQGYCPGCAVRPLDGAPAGTLSLQTQGDRAGTVILSARWPAQSPASFQRGPARFEPLSQAVFDPARR